ncbi:MAG: glycosyltransferase family 39 protein [Chitinispirillaceae bacterium]|nr:glycosyltransferase family 39 protein [Chitinispirillaceae bacterium]
MGKLILQGHPPYTLAYNMKLPGTYYIYALFMKLFGETVFGVHLGLLIVCIISTFMMFLIAQHFTSRLGALIACLCFGILNTSWTFLAQAGHATHFITFFALAGTLVLIHSSGQNNFKYLHLYIAGCLYSCAFLCKQSGLPFIVFGCSYLFLTVPLQREHASITIKRFAVLLSGFVSPVIIFILYFLLTGNFPGFWFWTVSYLQEYGNQIPLNRAWPMFKTGLRSVTARYSVTGYFYLWEMAVAGLLLLPLSRIPLHKKGIIFSFFAFSVFSIIPGFYFRQHYFITLIPALALLVAILFDLISEIIHKKIRHVAIQPFLFLFFIFIISSGIFKNADYLFFRDTAISCKKVYGINPFPESIKLAEYLKRNTTADDKIAVIGSEPQILFYADRYSATGYIYTYSLVEQHEYASQFQRNMAEEIEANAPEFILFVNIPTSWLVQRNSDNYIFDWTTDYVQRHYAATGIVDIHPESISFFKPVAQYPDYKLTTPWYISVFKRK